MKAVNLLPVEARHAGGNVTLRGASPATLGLLGGLALAVVIAFGYVALANGISDRRAELAAVNAQASSTQQRAAALKPYGDLAALRATTLDHVRSLAGGRYDWPAVLSRFARALPSDSTLTSFNGAPGATDPTTGTPGGPTVTLAGCTTSHSSVGTIMDRLRAVQAVSDVTLQSSTVESAAKGSSTTASGDCGRAETFALTVTLDTPAGATATTAAAVAPTTTPSTAMPAATTSTTPAATSTTTATPATTATTPVTTTPAGTP
jgi:Tfp pilus assembly protein PilN